MNAGDQPTTPDPAPSAGAVSLPLVPPPSEPAPGGVGDALADMWETIKGSGVFAPKVIGPAVAVAGVVAAWWLFAGSTNRAASRQWAALENTTGADLGKFASEFPDTTAGKVARVQEARYVLGPVGIGQLASRDPAKRKAAANNVESARDQFVKLADEFPSDLTLRAECLRSAAEAELALVGVPKETSNTEFRGSVANAVELYRKLAKAVGETTPVGEQAAKRADELDKKAVDVKRAAMAIYGQSAPPPVVPDLKAPADIKPVPTPTPPAGSGLVEPAPLKPAEPAPPTKPAAPPATKPAAVPPPPAPPAPPTKK